MYRAMWVADLVHWPTPVPLNSKPCFFCFHCCRWWEAPAPQKTCGRRSTLGNINNKKRDMTWVQPWPLSWVLSCQRDVSYLSSQHPWCPGGVTGAFPPCLSESLEQELFFICSIFSQLDEAVQQLAVILHYYFQCLLLPFYYLNVHLISFFLVKTEHSSLHIVNVFLQYQFSFYAGSSSFNLQLVLHLVIASSLLGFLGQNYCLGKNVTIFGKQFPQIQEPKLI